MHTLYKKNTPARTHAHARAHTGREIYTQIEHAHCFLIFYTTFSFLSLYIAPPLQLCWNSKYVNIFVWISHTWIILLLKVKLDYCISIKSNLIVNKIAIRILQKTIKIYLLLKTLYVSYFCIKQTLLRNMKLFLPFYFMIY